MKENNMNNKKLINQSIKAVITRLEKTEKFVLDQAPDVAKEMVLEAKITTKFNLTVALASFLASVVVLSVLAHVGIESVNVDTGIYNEGVTVFRVLVGIASLVAILISSITIGSSYLTLKLLNNCPKLFLLREFRNLLNGAPPKDENDE